MKAIAEYFRDLAADDRYFGAEPPTPDAEMLTRIAEREIERRVQARHEEGAIVLSAAPKVAAETVSEVADEPVEEPVVEAADEAAEGEIIQEIEEAEETTEEAPIEAEAAEDEDVLGLVAEAIADDEIIEDAPAVEPEVIVEDEAVAEAAEEFFAESDVEEQDEALIEELPQAAADDFEDDAEDTVNLFDDAISEVAEDEAPAAEEDSIAAKLRRIRAVVSKAEASDDDEDDYIEDQHADVSAPIDLGDDTEELVAEVEAVAEPAPIEEAPKPRARVIRMKRDQFEDAIASGAVEEVEDEVEAELEAPQPESSLSADDEADLMAELAEVDAELASEDQVFDPEVDSAIAAPESLEAAEEDNRAKRRARRAKLDNQEPGDEAVDRLIEEANTKLDEPEGNRRRSAIAHLRAAVAATKAEKEAGKSFDKEDNSDAYRQDLAETVRPREGKPAKSAPPLKLVAEQRVDTPAEEQPRGIRPRRVSVDEIAAAEANESSSNFVEFAENMGATQLPDIMEAAASYLTFVEGRKKFSRPMLMRLAYQMGDERFEREAGLRSFGQLLRDKKIEKIAGGRFTVSDGINFKPDDREAV
ncbi:MAG: hypothetical protein VX444_08530 [Pseudomonadota bacterium]|nr:hypothetical protein [Pseudomonadota bacterium]